MISLLSLGPASPPSSDWSPWGWSQASTQLIQCWSVTPMGDQVPSAGSAMHLAEPLEWS